MFQENNLNVLRLINLRKVMKNRWDIFKDEPVTDGAQLCYVCRKVVNKNDILFL